MTFPLQIATPEKVLFSGEVERLAARSISGDQALLAGHVNFCTALGTGNAHIIFSDGSRKDAVCSGGLMAMIDGKAWLFANSWEWVT